MAFLSAHFRGKLWRRLLLLCALAPVFLVFDPRPAAAAGTAEQPSSGYKLQAVFLFNFAQFVEWPASSFANDHAPLVIGIVGEDPFGAYLDDVVRGEKIGVRPIEIKRYRPDDPIGVCHILFVSRSESSRVDKILAPLKGRSVFTVSDSDNFTKAGGMVRFVTEQGKTRLRINLAAAKACELSISSKILRPATIVTAGNN